MCPIISGIKILATDPAAVLQVLSWGLHGWDLLVQHIPLMLSRIAIWRIWRPRQDLELFFMDKATLLHCPMIQFQCLRAIVCTFFGIVWGHHRDSDWSETTQKTVMHCVFLHLSFMDSIKFFSNLSYSSSSL